MNGNIFLTFFTTSLVLMTVPTPTGASRRQLSVHWNTSNPIFRIDNTDNVIDINKGNAPWEHDQVHIICPYYNPFDKSSAIIEKERHIIYNVNKEEFDPCHIQTTWPR